MRIERVGRTSARYRFVIRVNQRGGELQNYFWNKISYDNSKHLARKIEPGSTKSIEFEIEASKNVARQENIFFEFIWLSLFSEIENVMRKSNLPH